LGVAFDETVIKMIMPSPVLLNPGRYLNPSKKKEKKSEKKNPYYIFSSKSIFSPRYTMFLFRRSKKEKK